MKTLSIVIPVYNEEKLIVSTLQKVMNQKLKGWKKEIIIVDDGSADNTVKAIQKFIKEQKKRQNTCKLILQGKNQGKGAALKKGFACTTGEVVLVQDADLEYSPEDYTTLLNPFVKFRADVVYGSRFLTDKPRRILYYWHSKVNIFLTMFSNICTGLNLSDMETGYKAFHGELIRSLAPKLQAKRFGFEPEITARIARVPNLRMFEVGISYQGRTYAEGKKIGWKDGVLALWEILRFNLIER